MDSKMNRLRTPLGRAYGLGSARSGAQTWWTLRLVSVAMIPLLIWWVCGTIAHIGSDYMSYLHWMGRPITAVPMILTLIAVFYHMAVGIQEVLEDYVHVEWLKITLLLAVRGGAVLLAVAGIFAVLRIAFGS